MRNYVDLVNVYTGSIAHLTSQTTKPVMAVPHGMLQTYPLFNIGMSDIYYADKIYAFRAGPAFVMPTGDKSINTFEDFASGFDRDNEDARPYYYSVWLQDIDTDVEYSVSRHSGIMKMYFKGETNLVMFVPSAIQLKVEGNNIYVHGKYEYSPAYGIYEFSGSISAESFTMEVPAYGECAVLRIKSEANELGIRFGISLISKEQAHENLNREITGFDFERIKNASKDEWNKLLSKINVSGGRAEDVAMLYTCIYRAFLRMINFSEYGRYYSGFDKKIHNDDGHEFYCNDGMWDTFRSAHPLQMLLEPKVHEDICESYIRMFEQSGWLHDFPFQDGGKAVMLGNHTTAMFADSLAHDVKFSVSRAFEAVKYAHKEGSLLPWYIGSATELDLFFQKNGFFPALSEGETESCPQVHWFEKRQCVAVTLEQTYDDWCAIQLAKELGDDEHFELFSKRALNYRLLFNPETRFMTPKTEDGEFVKNFDPKRCGGQGGREYFAENNSWIYTLCVQHDVEGLARLFGSRKSLENRMDQLFVEQYDGSKYDFLHQYPDATGLIGQFCIGNEPSFHIPYIYNFLGAPWKTQKHIRQIIRVWFHNHPYGFCGDEDGGAMSSWFVFSALGIYPFCPGMPYYTITSPLFDMVSITMPGGKDFIITAPGTSGSEKYIAGAELNGKEYNKTYITYEEIKYGALLNLKMSRRPDYTWGTEESSIPPSYSTKG